MSERIPSPTADELGERRRAERLLRLMELKEEQAARVEATTHEGLRAAFATRFRALIGVRPDQRHAFRNWLRHRTDDVSIDRMIEAYANYER